MVEVLGFETGLKVPSFGIGTGNIAVVFAIFIILLAGAIIIWVAYQWRIYNKKIEIYENISGLGFQRVGIDRARILKFGKGGEELMWLKKRKVYRTAYGRKMGKNTYWFAIGQDGYWYNILLGDLDTKLGMLDIEPIDRDMRYMHTAIRKIIQDSYKEKKILTATTIVVAGIVLTALIIIIGGWFILDKIGEVASSTSGNVEASRKTQEATQRIIASLENVCSGSGLRPVES